MSDWVPILAGALIIIAAVAITRLAPNSAWAQELRRSYGISATGSRGNRTRRDHLRAAGIAAALAVLLATTSVGVAYVGQKAVSESNADYIAQTYALVAFLFAAMATLAAVRSAWKAARWRVELPDTPAHRRGLADAIDRMLDGEVSAAERAEFLDVRYLHPQLEQIRRAVMLLAAQHRSGFPEGYRTQIKEWTAIIRGSVDGPSA